MPLIRIETPIAVPRQVAFDVARNIDLHPETMPGTQERVVARGAEPYLALGDVVTLEAVHFGIRQQLTARITEFVAPEYFTDTSVKGIFRKVIHRHEFRETSPDTCVMLDLFEFESPLGVFGKIANHLFLTRYMTRALEAHAIGVKTIAEREVSATKRFDAKNLDAES